MCINWLVSFHSLIIVTHISDACALFTGCYYFCTISQLNVLHCLKLLEISNVFCVKEVCVCVCVCVCV